MRRFATAPTQAKASAMAFSLLGSAFLVLFMSAGLFRDAAAQDVATCTDQGDHRICVVAPDNGGIGNLNQAIHGDTTATGERVDLNTIYVLQQGGVYLLNGSIENEGYHLHIRGESGEGELPIVLPGVSETAESARAFVIRGDLTVENFYVTHLDQLGGLQKNMFRVQADDARVVVDSMFLDYDQQSFFRLDNAGTRLFLTNTTARNSVLLSDPGNGRIIDTRGNSPDTVFVENSTFYHWSTNFFRDGGGVVPYFWFNHNTIFNGGGEFDLDRAIEAHVTNNVFANPSTDADVQSSNPEDTLQSPIFEIDSLLVPGMTEADRLIEIRNNNIFYTQPWLDWWSSTDSLHNRPILNARGQRFVDTNPNIVVENNITEVIAFENAPPTETYVAFWQDNYEEGENPEPPDFRADENGLVDENGIPTVGVGDPAFDFSYPTTSASYTAAAGGFPLGDLNWFPEQKQTWLDFIQTDVDESAELPGRFVLRGNYPNPFNPSTTIVFDLKSTAEVRVSVYDLLGRRVLQLPAQQVQAGSGRMIGLDASSLSSGVYLYQVQVATPGGVDIQSGRMVLLK